MFRKILFCLFLLIVLVVSAIAIFILTFDLNDYRRFAEQKLSSILGRPVMIESMETKLAFIPTIKITGLKIGNPADLSQEAPLFKINQMEAVLELIPLLSSNVNVHKIKIQSAELNLVGKADANNWIFANAKTDSAKVDTGAATKNTARQFPAIRLDTVDIDSLVVSYTDDKQKHQVSLNTLTLTDFHVLSGNLVYNGQTVKINLNTGRFADFLKQQPDFPIDFKAEINRSNFRINAKIGDLKEMNKIKMTVSASVPNPNSLMRGFGIQSSYIPSKLLSLNASLEGGTNAIQIKQLSLYIGGKDQFNLSAKGKADTLKTKPYLTLDGQVSLNDSTLSTLWGVNNFTSDFALNANNQRLNVTKFHTEANRSDLAVTGSVVYKTQPPKIEATITSDFFNINDFAKIDTGKKVSTATPTNKKNAAKLKSATNTAAGLPWDILSSVDASVKIGFKNIPLPEDLKGYVQLNSIVTLNNGKANIPFEVNILNGSVKGVIDLDKTTQTASTQLQARNLKLDDVRALNKDIQAISVDADISLAGKGRTYQALLSGTNGQIVVELSDGYIINEWFVKLPQVLNLIQKQKTTVSASNPDTRIPLICGAANLMVKNGIIKSDDQLAIETGTLNFVADGTIDLGKQSMDISMTPFLNQNNVNLASTLTSAQVVRVSGPFTNLSSSVNPVKSVDNLIQSGLQMLANNENPDTTSLCQKALGGYQLIKTKKQTPQKVQKVQTPVVPKPVQKKEFKQQFLDSLSQVLQGQLKNAH